MVILCIYLSEYITIGVTKVILTIVKCLTQLQVNVRGPVLNVIPQLDDSIRHVCIWHRIFGYYRSVIHSTRTFIVLEVGLKNCYYLIDNVVLALLI